VTATLSLIRLMTWLSPAFPVGSFNFSHGLEQAIATEKVVDAASLESWIAALIDHGSIWNDAVLMAESWRQARDGAPLDPVAELAEALASSAERHFETMTQGRSFLTAARAWQLPALAALPDAVAFPVAVGAATGAAGIALSDALAAFLHAFASNQVQCALRLLALGQTGGVATLSTLEPVLAAAALRASQSTLDDLGASTLNGEIVALQHETLATRIFRT